MLEKVWETDLSRVSKITRAPTIPFADEVTSALIVLFAGEVGTSVRSVLPVHAAVVCSASPANAGSTPALIVSLTPHTFTPVSFREPISCANRNQVSAEASSALSVFAVFVLTTGLTIAVVSSAIPPCIALRGCGLLWIVVIDGIDRSSV